MFSCVEGWVLWLCVGGCASPCAGLVLFVGVHGGDVRRFVVSFFPGGVCAPTPNSPPSHPSVLRAFGVVFQCVPLCVYFSRVVVVPLSLLRALTCVLTFFVAPGLLVGGACTRRWHRWRCLAA